MRQEDHELLEMKVDLDPHSLFHNKSLPTFWTWELKNVSATALSICVPSFWIHISVQGLIRKVFTMDNKVDKFQNKRAKWI